MEGQKSDHLLLEAGVRQKVDAGMRKLPVVTEILYMGNQSGRLSMRDWTRGKKLRVSEGDGGGMG